MPHNQLRLQGGVIETETPVINQTGIASSNRIRFLRDPQGLSLPQKLGGWARFFASQITAGVVRALWGWQDTNNNQWVAYAADSSTATQLGAIQCTVSGVTGLTTATGPVQNITPNNVSSQIPPLFSTTVGSNQIALIDQNVGSLSANTIGSIYISTPVSVGGITLQGSYPITQLDPVTTKVFFNAFDILGNPLNAVYTTGGDLATGVTFTLGTPNTLTVNYTGPYTITPGQGVNISDSQNKIAGSYIVLSSTSTSFVVATTLSAYTYAPTVIWNNNGMAPLYTTSAGSYIVTVTFPQHGMVLGGTWTVVNPTIVGGITLYGLYSVASVISASKFTFYAEAPAVRASTVYQNAIPVTGGSATGTAITVDYSTTVYTLPFQHLAPSYSSNVFVNDVNPSAWNGQYTESSGSAGVITYPSTASAGSWVSGGTVSPLGGVIGIVYNLGGAIGSGDSFPGSFWTLDNWGNDLIAVSNSSQLINYPSHPLLYQPIYYWDATSGLLALAIPNGPVANNGAFIAMPQRQIIAWGSTFTGIIDPLLIRWCDINNFNTWAARITNQAGSFRIPSGSAIIGARQANQQAFFWTDIEVWSMTYINQPYVYSFNKIGVGCGLVGKYAHGILNGVVYWRGRSQFFMLSGEGVTILPCPIWDVAFQDLDEVSDDKIVCATNAMFNEVAWYYPSEDGPGENTNYVKYNTVAGIWDFGVLDRSAWLDVSVLQQPIGFSPTNKYIYQHEISPDADGAAMGETFTTGWFALAEGDVMPYVDQIWPDFIWGYFDEPANASINISFAAQAYPGATQYSYGPYTVSQSTTYISPRIRNRLVNFTVSGTGTGTWWRLGGIRYRVQPDGKF